jgi:hypothetical protein
VEVGETLFLIPFWIVVSDPPALAAAVPPGAEAAIAWVAVMLDRGGFGEFLKSNEPLSPNSRCT